MKISAQQVRWFRLRRSGLVEPFAKPKDAAAALFGIQAQLAPAMGLSLWNRTRDLKSAALDQQIAGSRQLVKLWGQRNTMHLYDSRDWPLHSAAFVDWQTKLERRLRNDGHLSAFMRVVRKAERRLEAGAALAHADVRAPSLEALYPWRLSYIVFMFLARRGVLCSAADEGRFVHREHWLPKLRWRPPASADDANREIALRYLDAHGPATAKDLAFWHGSTGRDAQRWIASLDDAATEVTVDGESRWVPTAALDDLRDKPPAAAGWPAKLLYRFDPLLLATKDKSWLVDDAHYKKVWLPSAHVAAVLLVRGRIAGTWRYDRKGEGLDVTLTPFAPLTKAVQRALAAQAEGVAAFLGLSLARLVVD